MVIRKGFYEDGNFADQVLYAPCSKVTEEMACEILGI